METTHLVLPAIWQIAGVIIPTLAVIALFVRLGGLLRTVDQLEKDVKMLTASLGNISNLVIELKTWREMNQRHEEDLMARIRRIEDHLFKESV
jgi:hypothetical protein